MCDEDGVVAIVEGLQDAGLAVTVLNRRLLRNRNLYRRAQTSKSSVETNTERAYGDSFHDRGTSVRDGHYASSYQIAHCSVRPTSPQQSSPEFPPQRCRPSRTEGNFEVSCNYGAYDTFASPSRTHRRGHSDRFDRGSMYGNNSERLSHETFAHSLRRYPTSSPERSISSELVQKLLSYTQNKYLSKSTSKSQRLLNRERSPQISKSEVKPSKNIQTYTRTKREVNTRDSAANTTHDLKFPTEQGRNFSTLKDKYRYKSENIETTYDYLEVEYPTSSRHSRRTSEVRYLKDFKKYIRNTIQQIYDDKPLVCPKIRSRYSHHRKLHHNGQNDQTFSQSIKVQASTSKATVFTHCEAPLGTYSYPTFANANTSDIMCCNCNKPRPCICEQKAQKAAETVKNHIADWVNELPVYTDNTREHEREKEQLIKELGDIISKVPKDKNYNENLWNEIESFVEKLPMWDPGAKDESEYKREIIESLRDRLHNPEDRTTDAVKDTVGKWLDDIQLDRNIDMDKTVNNFAGHLTPLLDDVGELKNKLKDLLENLPITNKHKVINDIQDDFANDLALLSTRINAPLLTEHELENEINEFLEAHPEILDHGDKVKNLVKKLKNTQSKPISNDTKEEEMKENVVDWIDTLPKSIRSEFTPKKKEEFSNDLVDKVQRAADSKASEMNKSGAPALTDQDLKNEITEFLEVYPDILDQGDKVKNLVKKLKNTQSKPISKDMKEEEMKENVVDWIDTLPKSIRSEFTPKKKEKFSNELVDKVQSAADSKASEMNKSGAPALTEQDLKNEITEFLEVYPDILDQGDKVKNLVKKFKNTQSKPISKDMKEEEMKENVVDWIDTLPKSIRSEFTPKKKEKFSNDLVDKVQRAADSKASEMNKSGALALTDQDLKNEITEFLEVYPDILDQGDKVKNLVKKLKNTQSKPISKDMKEEEMKENVVDWIDTLPKSIRSEFTPKKKEKFSNELVDKVQSAADSKASEMNKSGAPALTDQDLKNEITEFLEVYPEILDQGDKVKNLVKKLKNTQSKPISKEMKEEEMKENVVDWIDTLPKSIKDKFTPKKKENFSNDLVDKVQSAADSKASEMNKSGAPALTDQDLKNEITEFLEVYPDILDQGDKVKNLVKKLKNTQSKPISKDKKEEKMKENVVDWIDTLPKNIRDKFTPKKKENFSNDLVDKVQSAADRTSSSSPTLNEIENEIWDILESMDMDPSNVDKPTVKKYALNLKEIEKSDIDDKAVAFETIDFLNELDLAGIPMRSNDQDKFQHKVLDKLKKIQAKDTQSSGGRRPSFVTSTPRKGGAPPGRDFNESSIGEVDEYSNAGPSVHKNAEKQYSNKLTDQIESWIDTLPLNLDGEKKNKKMMIDDLASDIMDRQKYLQIHPSAAKSDTDELEHMKYQIFRWLNKMDNVKDHEIASVIDKTKNLMDKIKTVDVPQLNKSGLRSATREQSFGSPTSFGQKTYIPTQDPSMFIKENLDGAITDWIKQLPLYEKANPEQKRKFEQVVPEISKGIKRVCDGINNVKQDIDKLVINEIGKQMENFPISAEDKSDDKFMTRAATQLLQYLKDQKMFQDISERTNVPYDEYLKQYVENWANSFSLTQLSSTEKMQFKDLKNELTLKLKQAREDRVDEDKLKSEINKYLNKFPLKDSVKTNNEYQDGKVDELLKALSTLPVAADPRIAPDIDNSVRKVITKWMQKLPLDRGKTVTDIPEDAIENMAKRISGALIHTDEIPIKEVKETIQDATVTFLDKIPLDPGKKQDTQVLADDLFENVKDISKGSKTLHGVGSSKRYSTTNSKEYETISAHELKSVGDNLSGAILHWMKQQPVYSDNKAELDKLALDLSKKVCSILNKTKGEDPYKALIDEMTIQFKNTPLESNYSGGAAQLVQYLKDLQMLQDTPKTTINISYEDLEDSVDNFVSNNLELQKGTWADKEKFVKLKSELVTKLKELIDDDADQEEIKKEIQYYFSRFPLSEDERRDNRFLERKAEDLFESLPIHTSPDVYNYIRKAIMKWMKSLPLSRGKTINDIPKQAIDQITRRLSEQLIHTEVVSVADTKKMLEEETNQFLQNIPLDKNKSHDPKKMAKDLFDYIKVYSKESSEASSKDKTTDVSSTSAKGNLPTSAKEFSAEESSTRTSKVSNVPTSTEAFITSNKSGMMYYQDKNKASSKDKATKGSTSTKGSKLTSTETLLSNKSGSMHPSLKSAADQLADNVEQWVDNLPIKEDTSEEKNKASDLRRYLSSKIITKVSELNTNPEIFNDDFLYEEMFEDEVDNLITALSSDDLKSKMPPHKKSLIEIVKTARLKTQEEMAGTVYKQQLREVVSKTVPSESLSENENASFEVLKEDVADAFVSLHYVKGDAESKKQFKNNVKGEIDEFCTDYLKTRPKPAVDTEKLNNDLYKALKDVPVPNDETMRHEIEIIKIKEVINQWINEGKLFGDQTGGDRLKTKKKISVLAKKVHDIEKLKESNPDFDSDDVLKKDIIKWLEKMPLIVKTNLDTQAEQLIKKLKATEESRKLLQSDSSGKESILPASSYSNGPWSSQIDSNGSPRGSRPRFSSSSRPSGSSKRRSTVSTTSKTEGFGTHGSSRRGTDVSTIPEVSGPTTADASTAPEFTIVPTPCAPPCGLPPSSLSPEDKEYLRKIRERVIQSMTQGSPRPSKDAEVSPIPVDYGSQTEITTDKTTTTPQVQSSPRLPQTSGSQTGPGTQAAGSQVEIVPDVIVKEYHWDSINSKMKSNSTCPPTPCQPCRKISEATSPSRSCYPCPPRTSQHAQTPPPTSPEDNDPVFREHPFLPDYPEPCFSKCRQKFYNVGPKLTVSNRNLAWSQEDFYGDRREPSHEDEMITDTCRKIKRCPCKDRLTIPCHMKKRNCKSCRAHNDDTMMRSCPKCCGVHCPFPSYFYFKR